MSAPAIHGSGRQAAAGTRALAPQDSTNARQVAESRPFGQFTLGREPTLGGPGFPGEIDEVRLFTYPLSEDEVQRLFKTRAAHEAGP